MAIDESLALLREGYRFIGNRCAALGSDVFETRLLGQRTICLRGAEGARVLYDTGHMERRGAMPLPVKAVLLGQGGVQGLDGAPHRERKAMLMSLMSEPRRTELVTLTRDALHLQAEHWQRQGQVVLLAAFQQAICRAVCAWAGVPLPREEVPRRAGDMNAMITGAASLGWGQLRGYRARWRSERWIGGLVDQYRAGNLEAAAERALGRIAGYRDRDGNHLERRVAAVETLNVLRPTVALAYYFVFTALALHRHPESREQVVGGGDRAAREFVQEVRRYFPFFPVVAARVSKPFVWRDIEFPARRRVLLDLYGTNHDARLWAEPETFRPSRFAGVEPDPYQLVPQGGGTHDHHHRCAGEWLTLELMAVALRLLANELDFRVPDQNLTVPLNRFPTAPVSGFVITAVHPRHAARR